MKNLMVKQANNCDHQKKMNDPNFIPVNDRKI